MKQPKISPAASVLAGAVVVADVTLGAHSCVWYNAVVRGDVDKVVIGQRTNVQDCSMLHCSKDFPLVIEDDVTVGHSCILHGCTIGKGSLIGMGSTVLDGAHVGENCLIGAGSLVTGKTVIPDGMMAFGRPAKVVRPLTPQEIAANYDSARHYVELAQEAKTFGVVVGTK